MPKTLTLRRKLLFASILCGGALLLGEGALRLLGFRPLRIDPTLPNVQEYFWISDPRLGFRNRPEGDYVYPWIASQPRVTTDGDGFRNGAAPSVDAQGEKHAGPALLFIGDSTTFCAEVDDAHTGPATVEQLLAEHQPEGGVPRVINAGCRGYSTLQSLRMAEECLQRDPQIRLVVYSYCGNDFFENLNPGVYAPALAPHVWWDADQRAFVEYEPSEPASGWGEPFWKAPPPRGWRRRTTDALRARSALVNQALFALRNIVGADRARQQAATLPQGSVIGSQGADRAAQEAWALEQHGQEALEELLQRMRDLCTAHGAQLVVTWIHTGDADRGEIARRCAAVNVTFVDISAGFPEDRTEICARKVDGTYDPHYDADGTAAYAQALLPELLKAWQAQETAAAAKGDDHGRTGLD